MTHEIVFQHLFCFPFLKKNLEWKKNLNIFRQVRFLRSCVNRTKFGFESCANRKCARWQNFKSDRALKNGKHQAVWNAIQAIFFQKCVRFLSVLAKRILLKPESSSGRWLGSCYNLCFRISDEHFPSKRTFIFALSHSICRFRNNACIRKMESK